MLSVNLTTAFLVTQFALLAIVFFGLVGLAKGEPRRSYGSVFGDGRPATYPLIILYSAFALCTIGTLIFSTDVMTTSRPVFGEITIDGWSKENAFLFVFIADIIGSALLIFLTGGARISAFSPVLFILPTLAIFLRESPTRFLSYTFFAAVLFLFTFAESKSAVWEQNTTNRFMFIFVSLACLAVTTMVGYVTRPL